MRPTDGVIAGEAPAHTMSCPDTNVGSMVDGRRGWRAGIAITNILNGHGDSFGFGNPFPIRIGEQRIPTRPRPVTLRIEPKF